MRTSSVKHWEPEVGTFSSLFVDLAFASPVVVSQAVEHGTLVVVPCLLFVQLPWFFVCL